MIILKGFQPLDFNELQSHRETYNYQSLKSLALGSLLGGILMALVISLVEYSLSETQKKLPKDSQRLKLTLQQTPIAPKTEPTPQQIETKQTNNNETDQQHSTQPEEPPESTLQQIVNSKLSGQIPTLPPANSNKSKISIQTPILPATEQEIFSGVFDGNLRRRLNQSNPASSQSFTPKPLIAFQKSDGSEVAQLDGKCFTVVESDISPTGKQWSLPTRCMGHLTESDRIANGLKAAMKMRFGEHTRN